MPKKLSLKGCATSKFAKVCDDLESKKDIQRQFDKCSFAFYVFINNQICQKQTYLC